MLAKQTDAVRNMFNHIAPKYDQLNHQLSFSVDKYWRRVLARAMPREVVSVLDLATGTGDLAIALAKQHPQMKIEGIDFSESMLHIARKKVADSPYAKQITFQQADALSLPYPDSHFDACTVAFGVRNFAHLQEGLREMIRVTKEGGHLFILEFGTPPAKPIRYGYQLYNRTVVPLWGRFFSRNKTAYQYLPQSIAEFPSGDAFVAILNDLAVGNASCRSLSFGIVNVYHAVKQSEISR